MYTKILVPLDGSTRAEGVLPYVRSLARAMSAPVQLLSVDDAPPPTAHRPSADRSEYFEKIKTSFAGIADVEHTLRLGNPADTIIDLAAEHSGTLIAMAAHGYSGAQRWLLGSIAEKVLHRGKNDLLIVRPTEATIGAEAPLETLLVPLDGSAWAEKVFPTVSGLATRLQSKIVLVRILMRFYFPAPEAVAPVFGTTIPDQEELWEQARAQATQYLGEKVEQLRASGLAHVSSVAIDGGAEGAAADIIDVAAKTVDSLVVMSTHGRSGLGRWLIGSVAERVVRHSTGPVLVIR